MAWNEPNQLPWMVYGDWSSYRIMMPLPRPWKANKHRFGH